MARRRFGIVLTAVALLLSAFAAPAAAGASSVGAAMLRPAGVPKVGSLNWSGYAVSSDTPFNYVHSRWVQPTITCPGVKAQFMSAWVGLDGAFDGTVEQDGSAAACKGPSHQTPVYNAWIEMFPANEVVVFPISPGDVMDGVVSYSGSTFTLTISDLTSGRTHTTAAQCAECQRSSAEWIVERPASCKTVDPFSGCQIDALAQFDSVTMTQNTTSVDGGALSGISAFKRLRIDMVDPEKNGIVVLADTSALGGQSFTVTWLASGKPVPINL